MLVIWLPSSDSVIVGPPLRLRSLVTAAAVAGSALPLGSDGPGGWWCCLPTTRMCIWCQQRQAGRQPKTEQDNVITDVNPIDWFHLCIILCHRLLLMPNYIQQRMWWQKQGQFGMILLARHPPASQPQHPAYNVATAVTTSLSFAEIIAIVIVVKLSRAQLGREEE